MVLPEKQCLIWALSLICLCVLVFNTLPVAADDTQAAETPDPLPPKTPEPLPPKTPESKPDGAEESVDPFTAIVSKPGNNVPDSEATPSESSVASLASGTGAQVSDKDVSEITYDQRQNGTQNVRIHLDDVTLIVAPSDGIMSLFAAQAQHAFIQNAGESAGGAASAQNASSHAAAGNDDPYAEFDELISTANFLKSHGGVNQQTGAGASAGKKKCSGGRCKGKRTKLNLTRYLLPLLANRHPDNQNEVVPPHRPLANQ